MKRASCCDGGPVNDVYFTVSNTSSVSVSSPVHLHIAADTNLVGWYSIGDPSVIHWITSAGSQTGSFSFDPVGPFGLVGNNDAGNGGDTFYSQTTIAGTQDSFGSHFAFFGSDPPSSVSGARFCDAVRYGVAGLQCPAAPLQKRWTITH